MKPSIARDEYESLLHKQDTTALASRYASLLAKLKETNPSRADALERSFLIGPVTRGDILRSILELKFGDLPRGAIVVTPRTLANLIHELNKHTFEYYSTGLPTSFNGATQLFGFERIPKELDIHEVGAGYLSERDIFTPYKAWTRAKRAGNAQLWALIESRASAISHTTMTIAVMDDQVLSFMSDYWDYGHEELLIDIEEELGLWQITDYSLDLHAMRVYLSTYVNNDIQLGLLITNGHSGHVAMSFSLFIKNITSGWKVILPAKYFYPEGVATRRRHMGSIDDVKSGLRESMAHIDALALQEVLAQPFNLLTDLIVTLPYHTTRQKEMIAIMFERIGSKEVETVGDVLSTLTPFYNTRGFASAVDGLLNEPMQELVSIWRKGRE